MLIQRKIQTSIGVISSSKDRQHRQQRVEVTTRVGTHHFVNSMVILAFLGFDKLFAVVVSRCSIDMHCFWVHTHVLPGTDHHYSWLVHRALELLYYLVMNAFTRVQLSEQAAAVQGQQQRQLPWHWRWHL